MLMSDETNLSVLRVRFSVRQAKITDSRSGRVFDMTQISMIDGGYSPHLTMGNVKTLWPAA